MTVTMLMTHTSAVVFFFFTSRSQSVIRLLASRGTGSTEIGQFCCKIQDQYGSSQTLCANLCKYIQTTISYNS